MAINKELLDTGTEMLLREAEIFWARQLSEYSQWSGFPADDKGLGMETDEDAEYALATFCRPLPETTAKRLGPLGVPTRKGWATVLLCALQYVLYKYSCNSTVLTGLLSKANPPEGGLSLTPVSMDLDPRLTFQQHMSACSGILAKNSEFDGIGALQFKKWLEQREYDGISPFKTLILTEPFPGEDELATLKADMVFVLQREEEGVTLGVTYNGMLFRPEKVRRLTEHLMNSLTELLTNPNRPMHETEMLTAEEKQKLVYEWNNTAFPYPRDRTAVQLFEEQAARTPDHLAVAFGGESLTYRQMNERANRAAGRLKAMGAGAGTVTGIMVNPALDMVSGILGILKTGAAYLPIDPDYPEDRIRYMLENSGAKVLLYQEGLAVPEAYTGKTMSLQAATEPTFEWDTEVPEHTNPQSAAKPEDVAYIIYTSGSTGRPKGVMIEHRSLVNLCWWHNDRFRITPEDRSAKYAGFGFDASVWEIFPYLLCGASIHIVPCDAKLDVNRLNRFFEEEGITVTFLPTQMCEQFIRLPNRSLRTLLTGGDRLKPVEGTAYELVNNYGPTENTVVATSYGIHGSPGQIPIGKPIYNTQIYILDEFGGLQPEGVLGELCIAGDSLARGYFGNEAMTEARFVPNPFLPGTRMYRTGDYARYLADGNIEFAGRMDDQVKIRGIRIELEEIEGRLSKHPEITDCTVIAREKNDGSKTLAAYYTAAKELPVPLLRGYLAETLPEAWLPAAYVHLHRMPVTANGKIDKRALPEPEAARPKLEVLYATPMTELERELTRLWEEVLEVDQVGADDNFFDLGGNSLLLVALHAKLEELFPGRIQVPDLFDHPSVSKQAHFLENQNQPAYADKPLASVMMKSSYFLAGEDGPDAGTFRFRVEEDFAELLRRYSYERNIELPALFLSAFLYQLYESCTEEEITVQALSEDLQWVAPVTVNFDGLFHFNGLLEQVGMSLAELNAADGYPAYQAADRLRASRSGGRYSIVPYFSYSSYTENMGLQQVDLYLQIVEDLDGFECICDYRGSRWNEEKVLEFMEKYARSVEMMMEANF